MRTRSFLHLALALPFSACSHEVEIARIPFHDAASGEVSVNLGAQESISIWTQLDIAFSDGDFSASYAVTLLDGGIQIGNATCNPLDVSVRLNSYVVANVSDPQIYRYQGEMNGCTLSVGRRAAGHYIVHADLTIPMRPAQLAINDISLVIKD